MAGGPRTGVVTGLAMEAATLEGSGLRIEACAGGATAATDAARAMIAGGARLLVSYGLAAGLDPRLGPGALLLPEVVVPHEEAVETPDRGGVRDQLAKLASFRRSDLVDSTPDTPAPDGWRADPALRAALRHTLGEDVEEGPLAGVGEPVMRTDQKLALFAQTGAVGADMESHIVAREAAAAGIPFVAIRVVSDPSNRTIPRCALAGLGEQGRIARTRVMTGLLLRPWEFGDLLALAVDTAQAMRRLRRVGRGASPLLARG